MFLACIKTRQDSDSQLRHDTQRFVDFNLIHVCIYDTAVGISVIEDTVSDKEAVDVDNEGEEAFLEEYTAEVLIEEVRSRFCLWNTSLRVYKEANRKKIVWEQIAQKFGKDG